MNKKKLLVFFLTCGILLFGLRSETRHLTKPLKIEGMITPHFVYVMGVTRQAELSCYIKLSVDSNPVDNALVRIDNTLDLTFQGNGVYNGRIVPYNPSPNRKVSIVIKPARSLSPKEVLATAEGTITDIVEIISPVFNENIDLSRSDLLTIWWRFQFGSGPLSYLVINSGVAYGRSIYRQTDVSGDHHIIPTSLLSPNRKYNVAIGKSMKDFRLNGHVTPDSRIKLVSEDFHVFSTFTTIKRQRSGLLSGPGSDQVAD